VSDADLEQALDKANVPKETSTAALGAYGDARISGLRTSLAILAFAALIALFAAQRIPRSQPGERASPV
jgi:hypothetical protein